MLRLERSLLNLPSVNRSGQKRCLVLADGFYEWRHVKNQTYPYYIHLKDHQLFAFGGIWISWTNKETNETLKTFSIITTQANPLLAVIDNSKKRMPVILRPEDEKRGLSDIPVEEALNLLAPYDEKAMEAHAASKLITTRGVPTNVPEAIRPHQYEVIKFEARHRAGTLIIHFFDDNVSLHADPFQCGIAHRAENYTNDNQ